MYLNLCLKVALEKAVHHFAILEGSFGKNYANPVT